MVGVDSILYALLQSTTHGAATEDCQSVNFQKALTLGIWVQIYSVPDMLLHDMMRFENAIITFK